MTTQHQHTTDQHTDTAPAHHAQAQAAAGSHTGNDRRFAKDMTWKTWPDWVNVVLGAVLVVTPMIAVGAPAGWFVTLGLIAVAVGLAALATASLKGWEIAQMVVGAVVFLSPWLGGFAAATGAAWTAWIVGLALIAFAAVGMGQGTKYVR